MGHYVTSRGIWKLGISPACAFVDALSIDIPTYCWAEKSISQSVFSATKSSNIDPSLANKSIILTKSAPKTYMGSSSIKKSRFWQNLSLQIHHYVPKMHRKLSQIWSTSIDLHPSLHKPFKIKDLSLLTHLAWKSVSRRFSWCNSQLLTPSGRRAMKETVFLPTDRLWLEREWFTSWEIQHQHPFMGG